MALVLLTNDDGIFAPGINALRARMEKIPGLQVWAVAPDRERSASGHAITMYRPLFPVRVDIPGAVAPCISVTGTPADSAKLAIEAILPRRPNLVIWGSTAAQTWERISSTPARWPRPWRGPFWGCPRSRFPSIR